MMPKDFAMAPIAAFLLVLALAGAVALAAGDRPRAREFGLVVGVLAPGPRNAITDIPGVRVGQVTLIEGKDGRVAEALPLDRVRSILK
jgi:hypothetical protein